MHPITRTLLALSVASPLAHGQLLQPVAQDRQVVADASNAQGAADFASDAAPGFGVFDSLVSASVGGAGGGDQATGSASQVSSIQPNAFVVSGTQSSSSFGQADSTSSSIASLEFQVSQAVGYEVRADYESYDGGFFSYDLLDSSGGFVASWIGIVEGPQSIAHSGQLIPDTYTMVFRMVGGGGFSFTELDGILELSSLSASYCSAGANSAGAGAHLAASGSHSIADNAFALEADDLPPSVFGLAFYGPNQIEAPFGDGFRCVGGLTYRLQPPVQATPSGQWTKALNFNAGPMASGSGQIVPGSDWNFQVWYRDSMGPGGTGSNTTDAVQATFLP